MAEAQRQTEVFEAELERIVLRLRAERLRLVKKVKALPRSDEAALLDEVEQTVGDIEKHAFWGLRYARRLHALIVSASQHTHSQEWIAITHQVVRQKSISATLHQRTISLTQELHMIADRAAVLKSTPISTQN